MKIILQFTLLNLIAQLVCCPKAPSSANNRRQKLSRSRLANQDITDGTDRPSDSTQLIFEKSIFPGTGLFPHPNRILASKGVKSSKPRRYCSRYRTTLDSKSYYYYLHTDNFNDFLYFPYAIKSFSKIFLSSTESEKSKVVDLLNLFLDALHSLNNCSVLLLKIFGLESVRYFHYTESNEHSHFFLLALVVHAESIEEPINLNHLSAITRMILSNLKIIDLWGEITQEILVILQQKFMLDLADVQLTRNCNFRLSFSMANFIYFEMKNNPSEKIVHIFRRLWDKINNDQVSVLNPCLSLVYQIGLMDVLRKLGTINKDDMMKMILENIVDPFYELNLDFLFEKRIVIPLLFNKNTILIYRNVIEYFKAAYCHIANCPNNEVYLKSLKKSVLEVKRIFVGQCIWFAAEVFLEMKSLRVDLNELFLEVKREIESFALIYDFDLILKEKGQTQQNETIPCVPESKNESCLNGILEWFDDRKGNFDCYELFRIIDNCCTNMEMLTYNHSLQSNVAISKFLQRIENIIDVNVVLLGELRSQCKIIEDKTRQKFSSLIFKYNIGSLDIEHKILYLQSFMEFALLQLSVQRLYLFDGIQS